MILELQGIARRFGDFALRDLSLRVTRGEYWVVLGPSGSGKSLMLHTIAGFHRPDRGAVLLDGRDATTLAPERRDVGLVFQEAALFPHLDVAGNIGYGMRARRLGADDRAARIAELSASLDLDRVMSRPVATLSGGEAQRVAIARALAIRPLLLLLDEPLSLVDHNARLALRELLARVHREFGLTTIHVTHSRDEALSLGDHVAVMLDGHIVQAGPTQAVFAAPRCGFVAEFLGADVDATTECSQDCLVAGSCRIAGGR